MAEIHEIALATTTEAYLPRQVGFNERLQSCSAVAVLGRVPVVLDDRPFDDLLHQQIGVHDSEFVTVSASGQGALPHAVLDRQDHLSGANAGVAEEAYAGHDALVQVIH